MNAFTLSVTYTCKYFYSFPSAQKHLFWDYYYWHFLQGKQSGVLLTLNSPLICVGTVVSVVTSFLTTYLTIYFNIPSVINR